LKEDLAQLDAELKGLFMDQKIDEMQELLGCQQEKDIHELNEYNCGIINKYYAAQRFDLLFQHLKFVAYTSFIFEYSYQTGLCSEDSYQEMMAIYEDIYEKIREQR